MQLSRPDLSFGIKSIWNTDRDYQRDCLFGIVKNIRGVADDQLAELRANYLAEQGAFYVHNHEYMREHFGELIADPKLGIYTYDGQCTLAGRLAIPLRMFDDSVQGFIGYSNRPNGISADEVYIKYLYPPKFAFVKSRYFYLTAEEYRKAVAEGYICLVDGIFDKIILQCLGINAVSLCGSALTVWHQRYLHFIKHKVVVADNDTAGRHLASFCKFKLENCVELIQESSGDVDSFIHSQADAMRICSALAEMKAEGFTISKFLPRQRGLRVDS